MSSFILVSRPLSFLDHRRPAVWRRTAAIALGTLRHHSRNHRVASATSRWSASLSGLPVLREGPLPADQSQPTEPVALAVKKTETAEHFTAKKSILSGPRYPTTIKVLLVIHPQRHIPRRPSTRFGHQFILRAQLIAFLDSYAYFTISPTCESFRGNNAGQSTFYYRLLKHWGSAWRMGKSSADLTWQAVSWNRAFLPRLLR